MTRRHLFATLLFGFACFTAIAVDRDRYVEIEKRLTPKELANVGLTPDQLARLNTALRAAEARARAEMPAAAGDAMPGAPRVDAGLDSTPIVAHVRGRLAGWAPGTVVELDNGQQWKVLKGTVALPKALDAPTVRLVPGIAGRWFLELDEDHPKARVYRID